MSDKFTYMFAHDAIQHFEAWVEQSDEHSGFWHAKVTHGEHTWEALARSPNRALGFAFQKMSEWLIKGQNASGSSN